MPNAFDRHEPNLPPGARDMLATIRMHGWSYAPDDHHAYTTGLGFSLKAPEIVVCAQASHVARDLLAEACRQLEAGVKLRAGKPYDGSSTTARFTSSPSKSAGMTAISAGASGSGAVTISRPCKWWYPIPPVFLPWQPGFDPAEMQPDLSGGKWAARG